MYVCVCMYVCMYVLDSYVQTRSAAPASDRTAASSSLRKSELRLTLLHAI